VRRIFLYTAAGLLPALGLLGAPAQAQKPGVPPGSVLKEPEAACGNYGTSVHFLKTPSEAARQAVKEEKLVFVLHVSGLFENPDFT
jgi:hypothetical protein